MMSPLIMFWMDALAGVACGLLSLTLLLLVLGVGLRQRLNQIFSLLAAFAALVGISSAAADITLWVDSRVLAESENFGNPLLWMELAAIGFYLIGPAMLAFAVTYLESVTPKTEGQPQPFQVYKVLIIAGFAAVVALLPAIFSHQLVNRIYLDAQYDLRRWELSTLATVLSFVGVCFELLTLFLFWQNRKKLGETPLIFAVVVLLVGVVLALVRVPFPAFNIALTISLMILGRTIAGRQIFRPLQTMTERLEATVVERTRELQLATNKLKRLNEQQLRVAQISQEIAHLASQTDPARRPPEQVLAARLVDLVHNSLGYHHIYVYQPDETNRYLLIRAAAGTSARIVLEKRHQVQIGGRSLVGQVAAQHRARFAEAEGEDELYFVDAALPGARAEMALPLLVGNRLLGVLDFQSIRYEAFSEDDLGLLTNLADQFAAMLDNARLLKQTEDALAEVEKIQRQYLRQAWQVAVGAVETAPACIYTDGEGIEHTNLGAAWSPEMAEAVVEQRAMTTQQDQVDMLAVPIILRGQVIGAFQLQHKPGQSWDTNDIEALQEIAENLGVTLETARLSEETRRLVSRERSIREISDQMQQATNMADLMRITTEGLSKVLAASQSFVHLGTQTDLVDADAKAKDLGV